MFSGSLFTVHVQANAQSVVTRHVRDEVKNGQARFLNRLPATESLRLNLFLPLRNEADLNQLLQDLYDPQSALFDQFLTMQEFTDRFGPTEDDYAQIIRFAEQNGLTVTATYPNHMVVNVTDRSQISSEPST